MNANGTPARPGTATYAGFRTRTLSVEGSGPRFVLVHGYTDSADTWEGVLRELASRGGSAVAVDLPGFGRADRLRPGPVLPQLDAFIDELVADQSKRGPVVLVGNSLGGCVTVRAASRGVPLLGAVTIGDPAAGPWRLRTWAGKVRTPLLLRLAGLPFPVPAPVFRLVARPVLRHVVYADRRAADPVVLDRFVSFVHGRGGHSWVARDVGSLAKEIVAGHGTIEVGCALLVVHGRKDRIVPSAGSRALHAAVPGSELLVHPRWGHCPQLDDPIELTGVLTSAAASWRAEAGLESGA